MLPKVYHLDECVNSKKGYELLTERGFNVVSHSSRFSSDTADEIWVPPVAAEGTMIVTRDRGGDGVMLRVMHEVRCKAILVSYTLADRPESLVNRLCDERRKIEAAFDREPLLIWLSVACCEASRHGNPTRLRLLGNGKARPYP